MTARWTQGDGNEAVGGGQGGKCGIGWRESWLMDCCTVG